MRRICVVEPCARGVSETFLAMQADGLPAEVTVVQGQMPVVQNEPHPRRQRAKRALRRLGKYLLARSSNWEITAAYVDAFRRGRAEAVLAQYGPMGVQVLPACRKAGLPLIVQFHGADATMDEIVDANQEGYQELFAEASKIVAGSRNIRESLLLLGANSEQVVLAPVAGVNCNEFPLADPANAPPLFIAVGRLVEKKAPHLTLLAFAKAHRTIPEARLRIVGDGPLLGPCNDLAHALGIEQAVTFLGAQENQSVREELSKARVFVQHSKKALSGDSEGTAISILEAGASGLPVVSTRHAGILDSVVENETGFLVDEGDVEAMAAHMARLAGDPQLAAEMGRAARKRIEQHYSSEKCVGRLWSIIEACIERHQGARSSSNGKAYVASDG